MRREKRLVIGLGTGRCGTKSLARILELPHDAYHLPWNPDPTLFAQAWRHILDYGGGVSLTYLNYVPFIQRQQEDVRFICLQREKEATIGSWLADIGELDRLEVLSLYKDAEDNIVAANVFPDMGDMPIWDALSIYYDSYYEQAEQFQSDYPNTFRIYKSPHALNDKLAQMDMKRFAGRSRMPFRAVRDNQLATLDGTDRELRILQRRFQRRLQRARAAQLIRGADPWTPTNLSELACEDSELVAKWHEMLALEGGAKNKLLLEAEEIEVSFRESWPHASTIA